MSTSKTNLTAKSDEELAAMPAPDRICTKLSAFGEALLAEEDSLLCLTIINGYTQDEIHEKAPSAVVLRSSRGNEYAVLRSAINGCHGVMTNHIGRVNNVLNEFATMMDTVRAAMKKDKEKSDDAPGVQEANPG